MRIVPDSGGGPSDEAALSDDAQARDPRLGMLLETLQARFEEPIPPDVEAAHLAAMMAAAVTPFRRRRFSRVIAVAVATMTLAGMFAGLSYAGVISWPSFFDRRPPAVSGSTDDAAPAVAGGKAVASPSVVPPLDLLSPSPSPSPTPTKHGKGRGRADSPDTPGHDRPDHRGGDSNDEGGDTADSPDNPEGDNCNLRYPVLEFCLPR